MPWRHFVKGCQVGNILEWYDFILYAYFSFYMAPLFFPAQQPFVSQLLAFGVFASGCIMRPFGSVLFGHIGDRYGRKHALLITVVIITLSTTSIGLLPTYATVGVWAPVLLTVCRLVQGLAVSGEEVGAAIFLAENAPVRQQAYASSLILGSVYIGLCVGAIVVLLVFSLLPPSMLHAWGWRAPFLLAFVFGVWAFIIRWRDSDSPRFLQTKHRASTARLPVIVVLTEHRKAVVRTLLLCACFAVSLYLVVVYMPTYYRQYMGFSLSQILWLSVISLFGLSVLVPLVGRLADRVGAASLFTVGCIATLVSAYPLALLMASRMTVWVMSAHVLLSLCVAIMAGSIFPLLLRQFPVNVRYTGIALGFNVAMTLFGSTAPVIALMLVRITGDITSPFWYLLLSACLSLAAVPLFSSVHARDVQRVERMI